ncbi:unnamed protein product [Protopolystoma xenopodis]|uniref:Uncharacterized protein n=1 Tax=Protopolystoma xenopodis TaxID=117903 RepID=A0A3S5CUS2_9PLAT|nr:unnamed protein product [Protopolystoma xenopodis]
MSKVKDVKFFYLSPIELIEAGQNLIKVSVYAGIVGQAEQTDRLTTGRHQTVTHLPSVAIPWHEPEPRLQSTYEP